MFQLLPANDADNFQPTGAPSPNFARLASRDFLFKAWRKVRANRGAAGIDAVSLRAFERNLDPNLAELSRNLLNRGYEPLPARYVMIPKSSGGQRELAIPSVRDRIAQRAVLDAIEAAFESQFLDCSFAYRPERSIEMATQRIVVARAQGYRWTVESDIANFFPAIDHQLLMAEVKRTIKDPDVLRLLKIWLDAGVLDGARPQRSWLEHWSESLAGVQLTARDAVNGLVNEFLSERLGVSEAEAVAAANEFDDELFDTEAAAPAQSETRAGTGFGRAAMKRLVQDGLLLAVAERAVLRKMLGLKFLGIGGAAIGLALAAPPLIRKARELAAQEWGRDTGALQGAPISPLLSNIHLHPFDQELTRQSYRLIRYCDDFVILCRTQAEARAALAAAESALRARRLQLNPDKTHLVPPTAGFTFLGYQFNPGGTVTAPPTVPDVVRQRVAAFATREWARAKKQAHTTGQKTQSLLSTLSQRLKQYRER